MGRIFFTSDLHIGHNKEFIYVPRGFSSVKEMNDYIVTKFNQNVCEDDTVFILGDVTLGKIEDALPYLKQLKGHIIVVRGNHDSDARVKAYKEQLGWEVYDAKYLKWCGYTFYLTHWPAFTANFGESSLKHCVCNLYGHTHQNTKFYQEMPWMFHVGVDSNPNIVWNIGDILNEMEAKVEDCKEYL